MPLVTNQLFAEVQSMVGDGTLRAVYKDGVLEALSATLEAKQALEYQLPQLTITALSSGRYHIPISGASGLEGALQSNFRRAIAGIKPLDAAPATTQSSAARQR